MTAVLEFMDVSIRRNGRVLLKPMSWTVTAGEQWVVLGPNGAGKSTLIHMATGQAFPTSGTLRLLGSTLGRVHLADLRLRIGRFSADDLDRIPRGETVRDLVLTGVTGTWGRWRESFSASQGARADQLMGEWGIAEYCERPVDTLSRGEQVRALIARALMTEPEMLILDEPTAGLDIAGREELVLRIRQSQPTSTILVTHYVEEIPPSTSHALLIRSGQVIAQGAIRQVMTDENLSATFGLPLRVVEHDGRWLVVQA